MVEPNQLPPYLMRWDHTQSRRFTDEVVTTRHRLEELACFDDASLCGMIDRTPAASMTIEALGRDCRYPSQWYPVSVSNADGNSLIALIGSGGCELRIHLLTHPALHEAVDRLAIEMGECDQTITVSQTAGQLRIAAPGSSLPLECDMVGRVIWQIRGTARYRVYPRTQETISTRMIEDVLSGRRVDALHYDPAFERDAEEYVIEPGQMIAVPAKRPFRLVSTEGFGTYLTTRYATSALEGENQVHRANRLIRRLCSYPLTGQSQNAAAFAKRALIAGVDRLRRSKPPFLDDWSGITPAVGDQRIVESSMPSSALAGQSEPPVVLATSLKTTAATNVAMEN